MRLSMAYQKDGLIQLRLPDSSHALNLFNYKADGSLLSPGIKAINYVTTLPGRSLMTADEFFKGVNYTYELAAESTRLGIKTFDDALKSGASVQDALKAKSNAIDQFLLEPPRLHCWSCRD